MAARPAPTAPRLAAAARRGAAATAAALVLACGAAELALAEGAFTADAQAGELTGLAADTSQGVYWTAARDTGRVVALAPDGSIRGTVTFGATPVDVQAVAWRDGRLWVGDLGNADGSRRTVTAYRLASLEPGSDSAYRSYTLAYADGPADAAAMAVSARGRLYVVTRGDNPGIYRGQASLVPGGTRNLLVRVADAPAGVTDATFTADGTRLVLRTADALHVLDPYSFAETASAALPAQAQGQALSTSLTGSSLLVVGQSSPATVESVPLPTMTASLPPTPATPVATASGSAPATPAASVSAAAQQAATAARQHGTVWSLVAAAVLSLLAAAVVVAKR